MGRSSNSTVLGEKHWEALRLISEGQMSLKDIAKTIGVSADYLYDLNEGNVEKTGTLGELFAAEVHKLEAKSASGTKSLAIKNKLSSLELMNVFLRRKMSQESTTDGDIKLVVSIYNALTNAAPDVEVSSMQWNYTKSLTAEELLLEFKKLKSLAEGAPKHRGDPNSYL